MAKLLTISISEQGSENVTAVSVEIDDDAVKLPQEEFTKEFVHPAIGVLLRRFPGNYAEALYAYEAAMMAERPSVSADDRHCANMLRMLQAEEQHLLKWVKRDRPPLTEWLPKHADLQTAMRAFKKSADSDPDPTSAA